MKIGLFGGSGVTGRILVTQAIDLGHSVTVLARNPKTTFNKARVVHGDVRNADAVSATLDVADVVISLLGPSLRGSLLEHSRIGVEGTAQIIRSMEAMHLRRLIAVSAFGASDSYSATTFPFRLAMASLLRGIYADKNGMEATVTASSIDWTIVRPTNLRNGPSMGKVIVNPPGPLGLRDYIYRADLASFLLNRAPEPQFIKTTIVISGLR